MGEEGEREEGERGGERGGDEESQAQAGGTESQPDSQLGGRVWGLWSPKSME